MPMQTFWFAKVFSKKRKKVKTTTHQIKFAVFIYKVQKDDFVAFITKLKAKPSSFLWKSTISPHEGGH